MQYLAERIDPKGLGRGHWLKTARQLSKKACPAKPVGLRRPNVLRMTIRLQFEDFMGNPRDRRDLKFDKNNCLCKQHSYPQSYPQTTTGSGLRSIQQLDIVALSTQFY